ncbi:MAG TPA: EthD domain-containing protein [Thermoanaerobaculia bacterium]|nr:EthD domain-containing protein [Thermoanaerobaculia bacterium]
MLKVVYCLSRRPDLPREEFLRYWRDVHGGIGARIPGLRRLVQSYTVYVPGDAHGPDFDGMAELWFDDVASLLAARQSPEWKASADDEANFIDHSRVAYFVTEELDFPLS